MDDPFHLGAKTSTSATRIELDRTSIIVVVMQSGALNVDDTDDNKVFSKDDMDSEDLDPGRILCLFPFKSFLQYGPIGMIKFGKNL